MTMINACYNTVRFLTYFDAACGAHSTAGSTQCQCNTGFADPSGAGSSCTICATNYYNYPTCSCTLRNNVSHFLSNTLDCVDSFCSGHGHCDGTGKCACNAGFNAATNCSTCAANYFNYPTCLCMFMLY